MSSTAPAGSELMSCRQAVPLPWRACHSCARTTRCLQSSAGSQHIRGSTATGAGPVWHHTRLTHQHHLQRSFLQLDRRRVACNGLVMPLPALETVHTSFGAAGLWAVIIAFATAVVVASVVAACLVCLRPLFRTLEQTTQAFEKTAKELEKAAKGVERATLVFQLDVPYALSAVEKAGNEIGDLGRSFNVMGGGKKKKSRKPQHDRNTSVPTPDDGPDLFGRNGMQRIVQDISAMTMSSGSWAQALSPSMELWRKRLSDVTSSFERASRREPPQGDEPPALRDMIASTSGADNVPDGESLRSQSQSWVDEWHRLAGGASDMADRVAKGKPPSPESQQGMVDSVKSFAATTVKEANEHAFDSDDEHEEEPSQHASNGSGPAAPDQAGEPAADAVGGAAPAATQALGDGSTQLTTQTGRQPNVGQDARDQGLDLSKEDAELLQRLLSREDVAHAVLGALTRAQAAAAAAAAASEDLQDALAKARAGDLTQSEAKEKEAVASG